jgi:hypothetical protein
MNTNPIFVSTIKENNMRFFTPPHQLRTKVTEQEQKQHEAYLLRCSIIECKKQITFFTEILNNPKASIEIQRQMINSIEGEELKIAKLEFDLKKYNN